MALNNFALRVVVISEDFTLSRGITTETEFDEVLFFPPSYTIRSIAQLETLIREALVYRISMERGRERARKMRMEGLTAWFGRADRMRRGVRLEDRNLGKMSEYLQDRNDAWDYLEVQIAPEPPPKAAGPVGGEGDRAGDGSGGRPLSPMFGTTTEAKESRVEARRRREEEQGGHDFAEDGRRRADRERLGRRFER